MRTVELPHRVSFFPTLFRGVPPDGAQDLIHAILFQHVLRHPRLAMAEPEWRYERDDDGLLDARHPRFADLLEHQFVTNRRDEVLWFDLEGETRLFARAPDAEEEHFSGGSGPLSASIERALGLWLAARKLESPKTPLPSFELEELVRAGRVYTELESRDTLDAPSLDALPVPALALATLTMLHEGGADASLLDRMLALDPDNPYALRHQLLDAVFEKNAERAPMRRVVELAPNWGKPRLTLHSNEPDENDDKAPVPAPEMLITDAEALAQQAIAAMLMPSNEYAIGNLGLTLHDMNRTAEAWRTFERGARVDPEHLAHHTNAVSNASYSERSGSVLIEALSRMQVVEDQHFQGGPPFAEELELWLSAAVAYKYVGALDEAIDLQQTALVHIDSQREEREDANDGYGEHRKTLARWQTKPRERTLAAARDAYYRRDPARVIAEFGRAGLENGLDVAMLSDALVATGREDLAPLAFAHAAGDFIADTGAARLAGALAFGIAKNLEMALELVMATKLDEPDENWESAIDRVLRALAVLPVKEWERIIQRRLDAGATTLARLIARDAADFVPAVAKSKVVESALGKRTSVQHDAAWLVPLARALGGGSALARVDAHFAKKRKDDLADADALVDGALALVADAHSGLYTFAHAVTAYFASASGAPSPLAGAYRQIANQSLTVVANAEHDWSRAELRALCEAIEPASAGVELWTLDSWLLRIERALRIDETFGGYRPSLVRGLDRIGALLRGEELTLAEEREANALGARGEYREARALHERCLRAHGGSRFELGEIAEKLDADEALDLFWLLAAKAPDSSPYWVDAGIRALERGDSDVAFEALVRGLPWCDKDGREKALSHVGPTWKKKIDVPFGFDAAWKQGIAALSSGDADTAIKAFRFCDAIEPSINNRLNNLAVAYARAGRALECLQTFSEIDSDNAPAWALGALWGSGRTAEAARLGRYALPFFRRANEFRLLGTVAFGTQDWALAHDAYAGLWRVVDGDLTPTELNAYGMGLEATERFDELEVVGERLLATGDPVFEACGAAYLSSVYLVRGDFKRAVESAKRAVDVNPTPESDAEYKDVLARVKKKQMPPSSLKKDEGSRRDALCGSEFRGEGPSEGVAPASFGLAQEILAETRGATKQDELVLRHLALAARERAMAPVDLPPPLGERPKAVAFDEHDELAGNRAHFACHDAGFDHDELDARGLVPLARAREIVTRTEEFRRGESHDVGGRCVWDSDVAWAALLSLEDADEFVREASRIEWQFHPRGQDNVDLVDRYGAGILPWIASRVSQDGTLVHVPWCMLPCLLALDGERAFSIAWRVMRIRGATSPNVVGPFAPDAPGDADERERQGSEPEEEAGQAEALADKLVRDYIRRHPTVSHAELARLANDGDERALGFLRELAPAAPETLFAAASERIGANAAKALWKKLELPTKLEPAGILALLDAVAERKLETDYMYWPLFNTNVDGRFEYYGMRLCAARDKKGDGWGIAFERISGADPDSLEVEVYRYGNRVPPGKSLESSSFLDFSFKKIGARPKKLETILEGRVLQGAGGAIIAQEEMAKRFDLRPGYCTEEASDPATALCLRAYLANFPNAFWNPSKRLCHALGLGDDAEILVVSDAFEHALGTQGGNAAEDDGHDSAWCIPPSRSKVYRSLAEAIASRDPTKFKPGKSNLDFRLHALFEQQP